MNSKLTRQFKRMHSESRISGAILFVIGLLFMLFLLIPIVQYRSADISYADCEYREYTVESVVKKKGKNPCYIIYVKEEEKPLYTSNLVYGILSESGLDELEENDVVYMYAVETDIEEYSFSVKELKSQDKTYITLEEQLRREKSNAKAGFVVVPVISVLACVGGAITFFQYSPARLKRGKKKRSQRAVTNPAYNSTPTSDTFVIVLAYLNRYGLLALFFLPLAFNKNRLGILILGILLLAYSAIQFFGYLLKWRFIFCSYQNAYHTKMTPDAVDWNFVSKTDAFGIPAVFTVFGSLAIIAYLFL